MFSIFSPLFLSSRCLISRCQGTIVSSITPPPRFDNGSPQPFQVIYMHGDEVWWLEYLPDDGQRVVTGSRNGTVRVWNLESGEQEGTPIEHNRKMSGLTVTRDGTKIISGACGGWIRVWDVKSHQLVREWIHPDPADYPKIVISSDDRLIAVAHRRGGGYLQPGKESDHPFHRNTERIHVVYTFLSRWNQIRVWH